METTADGGTKYEGFPKEERKKRMRREGRESLEGGRGEREREKVAVAGRRRAVKRGRVAEVVEPWIDVSPACPAGRERLRPDDVLSSLRYLRLSGAPDSSRAR